MPQPEIPMIKTLSHRFLLFPALLMLATAMPASAYETMKLTAWEYARWPLYCKAANRTKIIAPNRKKVEIAKELRKYNWSVGIWHYCMGMLRVLRAERLLSVSPAAAKKELSLGFNDVMYTFERVRRNDPYAAEMSVLVARAHRIRGDYKKARALLQSTIEHHPQHLEAYSAMAILHFDRKEYKQAAAILEEANKVEGPKSGQVNYFLGLAYVKLGRLDAAEQQARIARKLGYPLKGLQRQVARLRYTKASAKSGK